MEDKKDIFTELKDLGYRAMHRRNGQYWLMLDQPLTLVEMAYLMNRPDYLRNLFAEASAIRNEQRWISIRNAVQPAKRQQQRLDRLAAETSKDVERIVKKTRAERAN
jgi:hypothetical protein